MTELRRRFVDDMTLHGLAPTTRNVYVNAVYQLAAHYHRSPDQLGEQELRDYFTYLINKKRLAASTLHTYIFAIKFLFTKTLQKPWPTLKLLRARKREKLPVVLDPDEAKRLLAVPRSPVARMCAIVMYCCGLRISEALNLKIDDIDSNENTYTILTHSGFVWELAFTRDGSQLISASGDDTIAIWDVRERNLLARFFGHRDGCKAILFTRDDQLLVTGGLYDGKIRVWPASSQQPTDGN